MFQVVDTCEQEYGGWLVWGLWLVEELACRLPASPKLGRNWVLIAC